MLLVDFELIIVGGLVLFIGGVRNLLVEIRHRVEEMGVSTVVLLKFAKRFGELPLLDWSEGSTVGEDGGDIIDAVLEDKSENLMAAVPEFLVVVGQVVLDRSKDHLLVDVLNSDRLLEALDEDAHSETGCLWVLAPELLENLGEDHVSLVPPYHLQEDFRRDFLQVVLGDLDLLEQVVVAGESHSLDVDGVSDIGVHTEQGLVRVDQVRVFDHLLQFRSVVLERAHQVGHVHCGFVFDLVVLGEIVVEKLVDLFESREPHFPFLAVDSLLKGTIFFVFKGILHVSTERSSPLVFFLVYRC